MPISFANIPAGIKLPLYWVEVDPSKAGLPTIDLRALLVGAMTTDGNAVADVAIPIGTQAQADAHFGRGSELARMFRAFYKNNFANEVWGLPVAEANGAGAAAGTIGVAHKPDEAGTIHLYIAGEHVPVNVAASDDAAATATKIAAAINANDDLPVTAAITTPTSTVNLAAVTKGVNGNDISVSVNYYGSRGGERTPEGLVLLLPAPDGFLTTGSGVPSFTQAITNLGEAEFEFVALPYTDSTSLMAWGDEFGFSDTGRWGWARQHFGHVFSAKRGDSSDDYADLVSFGDDNNSGVISILGVENTSPTPEAEWAAAYCAKAQRSIINDPARPLQTLSLNGVKLAPLHERFNFQELNSLATHGIAIQRAGSDNQPMIAREQTTYQLNLYGQGDDAYELVTTLATLAKVIRNQRHAITSKYPRHKLANDGTRFGPGQAIVTPGIIKAELVAQYRQDEFNGLVEDTRNFKKFLMVERDPNDPNRLNVLYPPDLINQLRVFAVLAQFRIQYDRGVDVEVIGASGVATGRNASSQAA